MVYLRSLTKIERDQCRYRSGFCADLAFYKGPGLYQDNTGHWGIFQCGPFGLRQFYLVPKKGKQGGR